MTLPEEVRRRVRRRPKLTRSASPVLARRGLFGTDIEGYGRWSAAEQHEAQRVYEWAIRTAAGAAGLRREAWLRQAAGDGEFVVLPEGVHEPRLIAVFLTELAQRLHGHRGTGPRVRLKVAVHHGLIHLNGATGYPGEGPVVVARLLDSTPVRELLSQWPEISLAAIVSEQVYRDVVVNRYEGLRPELFRCVWVTDRRKDFSAQAWLYAPEADVTGTAPAGE